MAGSERHLRGVAKRTVRRMRRKGITSWPSSPPEVAEAINGDPDLTDEQKVERLVRAGFHVGFGNVDGAVDDGISEGSAS